MYARDTARLNELEATLQHKLTTLQADMANLQSNMRVVCFVLVLLLAVVLSMLLPH